MHTQMSDTRPRPVTAHSPDLPTGHPHSILARHDALGLLSRQERQAMLRWSVIRRLDRQEVLLRRGDPSRSVVMVLTGYIKLFATCPERDVVLDIVGPGDIFGEVAVLNGRPLQADAATLTRCQILAIDGRQFAHTLERSPDGPAIVTRLVSERLLRATDLVTDALGLPAPARLAKALLRLASLRPSSGEDEGGPLRMSQSDLGAMAGVTRESVNKLLSSWRHAGWIALSNGCVVSVDVEALSRLAQIG